MNRAGFHGIYARPPCLPSMSLLRHGDESRAARHYWKHLLPRLSEVIASDETRRTPGTREGVNGMLDYNNTLNVASGAKFLELNYAKSYQFGLNLFEKDFHIYKNYINLVTGLGFDFNHYAFSKRI